MIMQWMVALRWARLHFGRARPPKRARFWSMTYWHATGDDGQARRSAIGRPGCPHRPQWRPARPAQVAAANVRIRMELRVLFAGLPSAAVHRAGKQAPRPREP